MKTFLDLARPCPLDSCSHSLAEHDRTDETVTGYRCHGLDPLCCCGEQAEDLANEEWS